MLEKWMERRIGDDVRDERARLRYGRAASVVSLCANAVLFVFKLLAGVISGSVAITADAVNNLSDASSSVVSLLGFKLADKPADEEHPYGHGRYEYLSGLMVAVMILVIGVELMKSSVEKILHPEPVAMSWVLAAVLAGSILIKLWLSRFNRRIGKKIDSKTLEATADDSRNDVIATTAVLISTAVGSATGLMLDGYIGAAVAAFILLSGFGLVRETIDPMLGTPPSREQVESIRQKLMSYPGVLGIHDLMVHDYGPGRQFASVHLEMDAALDPLVSHDQIDAIERDFIEQDRLHLVVHYDPVVMSDPRVAEMRALMEQTAEAIDPHMSVHDLRIVFGSRQSKVLFDCVVPYGLTVDEQEIRTRLEQAACAAHPEYTCAITLEHGFVHQDDV